VPFVGARRERAMRRTPYARWLVYVSIGILVTVAPRSVAADSSPASRVAAEFRLGEPRFDTGGVLPTSFLAATNAYDYGDPTGAEQAHLEAVNRARLDPDGEAQRLGIDLFEGVPAGEISGDPVQPLTFNATLLGVARLHSQDMIANGYFAHASLDGRSPFDRMTEAGYQYSYAGENIALMYSTSPLDEVSTALDLHDALFLDEGVVGRGHRVNILNGNFKEVGIGTAGGSYQHSPYGLTLTCDFGAPRSGSGSYLLGVVYDDKDGDEFYDAGEGIGGVEIAVVEAAVGTTTASAGGYSMLLPQGTYTVDATLADGRTLQRQVSISDSNVKLDLLASEFPSDGTAPVRVGTSPGSVTETVTAMQQLELAVNTSNDDGESAAVEWFLLTAVVGGVQLPVFALTSSGTLVDVSTVQSLSSVAFDYAESADTTTVATLSMGDLGLSSGDTLIYAYAYTTAGLVDPVIENTVTLNVQ
jgi:uncharacterized protein YkwD